MTTTAVDGTLSAVDGTLVGGAAALIEFIGTATMGSSNHVANPATLPTPDGATIGDTLLLFVGCATTSKANISGIDGFVEVITSGTGNGPKQYVYALKLTEEPPESWTITGWGTSARTLLLAMACARNVHDDVVAETAINSESVSTLFSTPAITPTNPADAVVTWASWVYRGGEVDDAHGHTLLFSGEVDLATDQETWCGYTLEAGTSEVLGIDIDQNQGNYHREMSFVLKAA